MSRNRIAIGVVWSFAEQLARRGISFVTSLILAQFLLPEDFGLVAIVAVVSAIANSTMESGFRETLIRVDDASEKDFNTAYYSNLVLGAIVYLAVFVVAPFVAVYYQDARLTELIRVAGLTILCNMFQIVPGAIFIRQLNFAAQFRVSIVSGAASALIAIALVFLGVGVWALIFQMLTSALISALMFRMMCAWRPQLLFCRISLARLFDFGSKIYLSSLLEIVFSNIYVLFIAKLFMAGAAGLYFFAEKIRDTLLSQIVTSIQTVTYPALSALQNDPLRLKSGSREVMLVTTFMVFPAMSLVSVLSFPLFKVFFPETWWPAAAYLQLMSIAGALYPLHAINLNFLKVKGRSDLYLYIEILKKVISVAVLIACMPFGVVGILIGQIVGSLVAYFANSYFSESLIGYSPLEQITDFMPALVLSCVLALVCYLCMLYLGWPDIVNIIVFGGGFIVSYIIVAHLMEMRAYVLAKETIVRLVSAREMVS